MRADGEDGGAPLVVGHYALFDVVASGGMATVHLGRLLGPVGFGRTVAIKRLHPQFAMDQDFVTMFLDEARIVARIRHPNVVPMVDAVESKWGLFIVMEYIHGESFSRLLRKCRGSAESISPRLVATIVHDILLGLHAAHETTGNDGELLHVVHRDVSPQNVIVGSDGVARVLDFGVAKAAGRAQVTREGQIKGKLTYMAPEQIRGKADRRSDVFAAAVMLWEALTGRRFHEGAKDVDVVTRVARGEFDPPSKYRPDLPPEIDAITMRGLEIDADRRYQTARDMALDLERRIGLVHPREVGQWVERLAPDALRNRANMVSAMELASGALVATDAGAPRSILETDRVAPNPYPYRAAAHDPISTSNFTPISLSNFTPPGMQLEVKARRDLVPVVAILAFCGALLVVGLGLSAWALLVGRSPSSSNELPLSAASSSASAPVPSVDPLPLPSSSTPQPVSSAPQKGPGADPSARGTKARGPLDGRSPPSGSAGPTPPVVAPSPAKKVDCDPPFFTDEAGHRKYKRDCIND